MASPVFQPDTWARYTTALHLHTQETETARTSELPQFYADRFGWQHEVDVVVAAFRTLTPEEQKTVCIFASNYGEAGAIDFLGPRQQPNLHSAISGQNSYWMWGTHGCNPETSIAVIRDTTEQISRKYRSVTLVGRMDDRLAMPFEHRNIYLLRGRLPSAPFDWAGERFYY
jgi:hypothetical protein